MAIPPPRSKAFHICQTIHKIGHYQIFACLVYDTFLLCFIQFIEDMILSLKCRYFKEDTWLYFGIRKMNTISSNKPITVFLKNLQDTKFPLYVVNYNYRCNCLCSSWLIYKPLECILGFPYYIFAHLNMLLFF